MTVLMMMMIKSASPPACAAIIELSTIISMVITQITPSLIIFVIVCFSVAHLFHLYRPPSP